tara:strand:- start:277 stop:414 length:138 start_codon:yes stop_codon:yes gene_type:complete
MSNKILKYTISVNDGTIKAVTNQDIKVTLYAAVGNARKRQKVKHI